MGCPTKQLHDLVVGGGAEVGVDRAPTAVNHDGDPRKISSSTS